MPGTKCEALFRRARLLLEETAKWIALVALLALGTFVIDRTLRLSLPTRRGLLLVFLVVCGIQAWRWLLSSFSLWRRNGSSS